MFTEPASNRTTHKDIELKINVMNETEVTSKLSHKSLKSNSSPLHKCQVVLNDVFSSNPAEKLKLLKINQDKHHSVSSQRSLENHYREYLNKKDPIPRPSMKCDSEWESLDNAVGNILLAAKMSTILDRVTLLEDSVYSQGSLLFGFLSKTQKHLTSNKTLYSAS